MTDHSVRPTDPDLRLRAKGSFLPLATPPRASRAKSFPLGNPPRARAHDFGNCIFQNCRIVGLLRPYSQFSTKASRTKSPKFAGGTQPGILGAPKFPPGGPKSTILGAKIDDFWAKNDDFWAQNRPKIDDFGARFCSKIIDPRTVYRISGPENRRFWGKIPTIFWSGGSKSSILAPPGRFCGSLSRDFGGFLEIPGGANEAKEFAGGTLLW
jgi:hypothetical protein